MTQSHDHSVQEESRAKRAHQDQAEREQGAAMLIVMVSLMMVTATAIFAIHATGYEVRASGFARQAHQTQYLSESGAYAGLAWLDFHGPSAMLELERRTELLPESAVLNLAPLEPPLASLDQDTADTSGRRFAHRLYVADLELMAGQPAIDQNSVGGVMMAYQPVVLVDIYDTHIYTAVTDGERADGQTNLKFLHTTMTSRGRTRVAGDVVSGEALDYRDYHEGAGDSRVHGITGPFFAAGPTEIPPGGG